MSQGHGLEGFWQYGGIQLGSLPCMTPYLISFVGGISFWSGVTPSCISGILLILYSECQDQTKVDHMPGKSGKFVFHLHLHQK